MTDRATARAAPRYPTGLEGQSRVNDRAAMLLLDRERQVIAHGRDGEVLAAIQYVRDGTFASWVVAWINEHARPDPARARVGASAAS